MGQEFYFPEPELSEFCRRHHIRRLSLFGSVLQGTDRSGSDVDLLVAFESPHTPGFLALAGMEEELSRMLHGKKVDLHTSQDLSHHFRDQVLTSAKVQYAV